MPIDAILVGGAVPTRFRWSMRACPGSIFIGAIMAQPSRRCNLDQVGQVRRDPFAMLPFCGYHIGDYLRHWLQVAEQTSADKLPHLFSVNWFRQDEDGKFIWPGFGENSRVLKWIVERCRGLSGARKTAVGYVPGPEDLDLTGLDLSADQLADLLKIDRDKWLAEVASIRHNFESYGPKLPAELWQEAGVSGAALTVYGLILLYQTTT